MNKSESGKNYSKATVLSAAGVELLGNQGGAYTGALAPVGAAVIDPINTALCPGGAADPTRGCIVVLHSNSSSVSNPGGSQNSASAVLLGINSPADGLNVAGSASSSQHNAGSDTCTDVSAGYLLITKKQFNPSTPNNPLFSQAASLGQPC